MKPRGFVPVPSLEKCRGSNHLIHYTMQISDPILFELCFCGVLIILVGILFVCLALIAD